MELPQRSKQLYVHLFGCLKTVGIVHGKIMMIVSVTPVDKTKAIGPQARHPLFKAVLRVVAMIERIAVDEIGAPYPLLFYLVKVPFNDMVNLGG